MSSFAQFWMTDYFSTYPNMSSLPNVAFSAGAFYYEITTAFQGIEFVRLAEKRASDAQLQGVANDFDCEKREMIHFVGHSSSEGPKFIRIDANNGVANYEEVRWGRGNLRWVVIDGCSTLDPLLSETRAGTDILARWGAVFQGLRALYGFASISESERTRGRVFARGLTGKEPVWKAWLEACEETDDAPFAALAVNVYGLELPKADGEVDPGKYWYDDTKLATEARVILDDDWPSEATYEALDATELGLVYFVAHV